MPNERKSPRALIADYLCAYRLANGKPLDGSIVYDRGWFRFRTSPPRAYRRRQVEEMIARLRSREGAHHD